jgi:streptomycin 6-kinase
VIVDRTFETGTSVIAFGQRGTLPVVLKVVKNPGDEWRCGNVLDAFGGRGVVRVYEYTAGAALLEKAIPGRPLAELSLTGRDDEATEVVADVIGRMSPSHSASCPTVDDWAASFDRYGATGADEIPGHLVAEARHLYAALCSSQTRLRLLHGDLQHHNILFDADRGWLAIDPKGVFGEIECEIGPALRNPCENPLIRAIRRYSWPRRSIRCCHVWDGGSFTRHASRIEPQNRFHTRSEPEHRRHGARRVSHRIGRALFGGASSAQIRARRSRSPGRC